MRSVAVLAFPGVVGFDLAIACHVFGAARYEVTVCGSGTADAGAYRVVPRRSLRPAETADVLVVPGTDTDAIAEPVIDTVRRASGTVVSICTGAFVLGAAGRLDGRRCTTHWAYTEELARRHPTACVEPDVLYVDEGDLLTSAGVAAGIDLCLHIVARDRGTAAANRVARRMVVAPQRPGGQAQFIERPLATGDGGLAATRAWMLEHRADPLTVAGMAAHAGYSPRTFARRFRAETGTTPLAWLVEQRVAAARRALEETDAPVEEIAHLCGFGTATGLREHFRRATRTTPTAYRAAFSETARATSTSVRVANPDPPLAA